MMIIIIKYSVIIYLPYISNIYINILYYIHLFNCCFPKLFHFNITGIIFVRSIPSFVFKQHAKLAFVAFLLRIKNCGLNIRVASFRGKFLKLPLKRSIGNLYNHGPAVRCMNAQRLPFSHQTTLGPSSGLYIKLTPSRPNN